MIACQVVALSESGALTRALTVSKSAAKSCLELGLRARAAVHFVHVGFLTDVAKSTHSTEIREAALEAVDLDHSPEILGYCATLLGRSGALRELRGLLGSIPSDLDAPPGLVY